jgi:hypothetical protein
MKKTRINIGDVFEVPLDENRKKYFQLIAVDQNQLQSDVIRVFSAELNNDDDPALDRVVQEPVVCYWQCLIKAGRKSKVWYKVGNVVEIGTLDILFRSTKDFGRNEILISERWSVWRPNQERVFVGGLSGDLFSAEPGEVFPPEEIVYRMIHGLYKQEYQK